jgi:hypothetical protein
MWLSGCSEAQSLDAGELAARELGILFKEPKSSNSRRHWRSRQGPTPSRAEHNFSSLGFGPGIDLDKLGLLVDALEAEAFAEKSMILPDVNVLVHAHSADSPNFLCGDPREMHASNAGGSLPSSDRELTRRLPSSTAGATR